MSKQKTCKDYIKFFQSYLHIHGSLILVLLIYQVRTLLDILIDFSAQFYKYIMIVEYLHLMLWRRGSDVLSALKYSLELVTTTGSLYINYEGWGSLGFLFKIICLLYSNNILCWVRGLCWSWREGF